MNVQNTDHRLDRRLDRRLNPKMINDQHFNQNDVNFHFMHEHGWNVVMEICG